VSRFIEESARFSKVNSHSDFIRKRRSKAGYSRPERRFTARTRVSLLLAADTKEQPENKGKDEIEEKWKERR